MTPPGLSAVLPEGFEIPPHDRPSSVTVFSGTLGVAPDVWRDERIWRERRDGPFPDIPTDTRSTPYSRLYATRFPERKIPNKYFPGAAFGPRKA